MGAERGCCCCCQETCCGTSCSGPVLQLIGKPLTLLGYLLRLARRLREMREQPIGGIRFIAVSATIPNLQDVALWLAVPPSGIKCFGGGGGHWPGHGEGPWGVACHWVHRGQRFFPP